MSAAPLCRTAAQVESAIGGQARVRGLLAEQAFHGPKGNLLAMWPVLQLVDGSSVLLGSPWQPDSRPDAALLAPLQGRLAEAEGVLHGEPPGSLQNLPTPCLLPVAAVAAA